MRRLTVYQGRGTLRVTPILEALPRSHWQTIAALHHVLKPIASRRLRAEHLSAFEPAVGVAVTLAANAKIAH